MPGDDAKNAYCNPYWFIKNDDGDLYRIINSDSDTGDTGVISYECEHVIGTLIDDIVFGQHNIGGVGIYTEDVINYVLGFQETTNWQLDVCDFDFEYEYGWSGENLLQALFSIPALFTDAFKWEFDTSVYPWKISLKLVDESSVPSFYINANKNLLSESIQSNFGDICTKLYCLGYGEGINQLTISDVNDGLPYILAEQSVIDEYGIISKQFVDRKFEDAESLLQRGQRILEELNNPTISNEFDLVDLYPYTNDEMDKANVGDIARLTKDDTQTFITEVAYNHDVVGDMKLTLKTRILDVASTIADVADRQRIEQTYSQGATQLYAQSIQTNATPTQALRFNFYIPEEMRIINSVKAKIQLEPFRSYSQATEGGGASTNTSSSGGASTSTSSSGGGGTSTSSNGGGSTQTSGSSSRNTTATDGYDAKTGYTDLGFSTQTTFFEDGHQHNYYKTNEYHRHDIPDFIHSHNMAHTHTVDIPNHNHSVSIPSHTHSVSIGSHTHNVSIPDHTHNIEQDIYETGNPTGADIYINGDYKETMGTDNEINITGYLTENGAIPRGQWHTVEILPNDLSYITVDMFTQGFIQSRGVNKV
jgi:phage minor structural protein